MANMKINSLVHPSKHLPQWAEAGAAGLWDKANGRRVGRSHGWARANHQGRVDLGWPFSRVLNSMAMSQPGDESFLAVFVFSFTEPLLFGPARSLTHSYGHNLLGQNSTVDLLKVLFKVAAYA